MTINYFEAMRYVYSIIAGLFLFPCLSCSTDTAEWLDEEKPTDTVPVKGMKLVWNDEFNRTELDADKWFTQYYSTLDFVTKPNGNNFRAEFFLNLRINLQEIPLCYILMKKNRKRLIGNPAVEKYLPSRPTIGD